VEGISEIYDHPFVEALRLELRGARQAVAAFQQARDAWKAKAAKFEGLLKGRDRRIRELEELLGRAEAEKRDLVEKVETYKKLAFPPCRKKEKGGRKKGGQPGHKGASRNLPAPRAITETRHASLASCPDCGVPLKQGENLKTHTVTDIPDLEALNLRVTCFEVEEQYCPHCRKHVRAVPAEAIPGCRFGRNAVVLVLVLRHCLNVSLGKIAGLFSTLFGLGISPGGIAAILQRVARWFGPRYRELLEQIRAARWKHADETSWSIAGMGAWVWAFLTKTAVVFQIESTRGKAVPLKALGGQGTDAVLACDGYAGYAKVPGKCQACWSHVLSKSHDKAGLPGASEAALVLHRSLSDLFCYLSDVLDTPFDLEARKRYWLEAKEMLDEIVGRDLSAPEARKVQTYVKNRGADLLTAVLHPEGVLTNNLAERTLRPLVVTRKISGGSRSAAGAHAMAVCASVVQSAHMSGQPLVPTLSRLILEGSRA
jgi:transposase